ESFSYGEVEDYTLSITQSVPDTQAPTAPTNLAASSVTQTTLTLSWTASTDNVGVTGYDVYRNGSLLASTSGTSYNVSGLSAATTYSFYVKAKDVAGNVSTASNTVNATTLANTVTYCASKGNNVNYEWIQRVNFCEIDNNSGKNSGYVDFTSMIATVALGETLPINFQAGFASSSYTEYWSIWIDFDQNGTFDTDERVVNGSSSSSELLTADVVIPTDALLGATRMRVSMKYNAAQTACETFSYGEVEDYTINILQTRTGGVVTESLGESLDSNPAESYMVYPNPANDYVNISLQGIRGDVSLRIYDLQGRLVKETMLNSLDSQIDVSDLSKGVYIISVDEEKEAISKRLVKM
ncbi:MAG TPA: GEVED domain-containing protein, partial [Tenuifilaceae bacterium]|nr:GEVED domain-containing protein [Tenuifilaceae bacterium]